MLGIGAKSNGSPESVARWPLGAAQIELQSGLRHERYVPGLQESCTCMAVANRVDPTNALLRNGA
jgi:hypothetical protein